MQSLLSSTCIYYCSFSLAAKNAVSLALDYELPAGVAYDWLYLSPGPSTQKLLNQCPLDGLDSRRHLKNIFLLLFSSKSQQNSQTPAGLAVLYEKVFINVESFNKEALSENIRITFIYLHFQKPVVANITAAFKQIMQLISISEFS